MKYVGFVCVDAHRITRGDWWKEANVPTAYRKGNPNDKGFMWLDDNCEPHWMHKDAFERQFKKCL